MKALMKMIVFLLDHAPNDSLSRPRLNNICWLADLSYLARRVKYDKDIFSISRRENFYIKTPSGVTHEDMNEVLKSLELQGIVDIENYDPTFGIGVREKTEKIKELKVAQLENLATFLAHIEECDIVRASNYTVILNKDLWWDFRRLVWLGIVRNTKNIKDFPMIMEYLIKAEIVDREIWTRFNDLTNRDKTAIRAITVPPGSNFQADKITLKDAYKISTKSDDEILFDGMRESLHRWLSFAHPYSETKLGRIVNHYNIYGWDDIHKGTRIPLNEKVLDNTLKQHNLNVEEGYAIHKSRLTIYDLHDALVKGIIEPDVLDKYDD